MSKVKLDKYFRCSAEVHSGKELHLEVVPWGLFYLEWCSGLFRMGQVPSQISHGNRNTSAFLG